MSEATLDRTYFPDRGDDPDSPESNFEDFIAELTVEGEHELRPRLRLGGHESEIPEQYIEILLQVASAMKRGQAISVVPRNTILTTQEAADMLGVSRPTFVKLLEDGKIPYQKINRHRRVFLTDVVEYEKRHRAEAARILDDMVSDSEMYGDYDASPEEVREALARARNKA